MCQFEDSNCIYWPKILGHDAMNGNEFVYN